MCLEEEEVKSRSKVQVSRLGIRVVDCCFDEKLGRG